MASEFADSHWHSQCHPTIMAARAGGTIAVSVSATQPKKKQLQSSMSVTTIGVPRVRLTKLQPTGDTLIIL